MTGQHYQSILHALTRPEHLSNYNGYEHRLLTDGHLPLAELLERLSTDGSRRIITVELNPHSLAADVEERVRANLRSCVAFCKQRLL